MILGFIGTGKISSSIIYGIFKSKLKTKRIYISSRNRNIAKKLSKSYGKIKVLNNNQEIIDKSSVVFLGVTPNIVSKILPKLKFSKNKKIISLISTINLDKLKKITKNKNIANKFFSEIDSAIVMHNVSTQFADGGEFGMGAEIGIGTGKLHARGPSGAKELTSFKFIIEGKGILRK